MKEKRILTFQGGAIVILTVCSVGGYIAPELIGDYSLTVGQTVGAYLSSVIGSGLMAYAFAPKKYIHEESMVYEGEASMGLSSNDMIMNHDENVEALASALTQSIKNQEEHNQKTTLAISGLLDLVNGVNPNDRFNNNNNTKMIGR